MRRARHDLHVNAWGLALEAQLGEAVRRIRGPRNSYVAPPTRSAGGERRAIGPDELRLPGGRTPHGFLRTDRGRRRVAVEEFAAIEPDLTIELRLREAEQIVVTDLFVELDRTFKPAKNIDKFERYDHMISGWCTLKDRYAKHCTPLPWSSSSAATRPTPRSSAAPPIRSSPPAHAYGGEYASEWDYPGRERMVFVAERDVHDGALSPGTRCRRCRPRSASRRPTATAQRAACHPRRRPLLAVAPTSWLQYFVAAVGKPPSRDASGLRSGY